MNVVSRFILELVRILAMLIVTFGVLNPIIMRIDIPNNVKGFIGFIVLVIFVIWYKRRGQYTGWFNVNKLK